VTAVESSSTFYNHQMILWYVLTSLKGRIKLQTKFSVLWTEEKQQRSPVMCMETKAANGVFTSGICTWRTAAEMENMRLILRRPELTPCRLICRYQSMPQFTLKLEAVYYSETMVRYLPTTLHSVIIPETIIWEIWTFQRIISSGVENKSYFNHSKVQWLLYFNGFPQSVSR
jgi:hypothetical protein